MPLLLRISHFFYNLLRQNSSPHYLIKSVHVQHKMCLLLVINMLVCSLISYLEVSSRDYIVTSNKRISLQCDTKVK